MLAYTGIETVSNLAEEARDYGQTIPRGIGGVVGAVAVIYAFLPPVALSAMPVVNGETPLALPKEEGGYADDPILGVVANMDLGSLQDPAEIYVGVLAASILFIATNAGMIGVSRLTYSMGQYRQLPDRLRQLHPRYRTPYVAILLFGAHRLPDHRARAGRVPGQDLRVRGDAVVHDRPPVRGGAAGQPARRRAPVPHPLERALAGAGTACAVDRGRTVHGRRVRGASVLDIEVLIVGHDLAGVGLTGYVVYRRNQGLSLTQTTKVVVPKPIVEHEVEYESILVAFEDGQYSGEAVAMAVRLAARRRRGIHVLVTVTVPASAPIDAVLPEAESKAQEAVDQARVRGGRRVTGHVERVRAGGAGRRIVLEAQEIHAAAIVMPLPPRRAGASLFGRTVETVLEERPCRVILDSSLGVEKKSETPTAAGLGSELWIAHCTPRREA